MLASSDSNIAVDNLLEGLIKAGVRAVRLGRPDNVRPELLPYCVEVAAGTGAASKADEMAARQRILKDAEVVCATCIGVGSDQLKSLSFPCSSWWVAPSALPGHGALTGLPGPSEGPGRSVRPWSAP